MRVDLHEDILSYLLFLFTVKNVCNYNFVIHISSLAFSLQREAFMVSS